MAILFSVVTMTSGEAESRFIVGGIPRIKNDLKGWTAYEEFMRKIDEASEVNIQGKIYLYGDGEFVNATVEEVAYMYERIKRREDFLRTRCQYWNDTEFKLIYDNGEYKDEKPYPTLIGSSNVKNKKLRNMQEVAEFIVQDGQYGDLRIKYKDGQVFLKTDGIYVKEIADKRYGKELEKILLPMQREVEKGEKDMNEWEKVRRQAQRYKEQYPPGTRLQLINMEDPYAPVESGMRGTVKLVDDIGQIHMHCDNGRTLALVPGQDSFRTLTEEELAQEERIKNGKVVDFGDDCQIVIPKEPIDCSALGYFDELENDCWDLVKGYLAKFGIELLPNEDGEEPMSDYVAKGVQDKIVELLQEAGVEFKFEQDEKEEPVEEGGMNMA